MTDQKSGFFQQFFRIALALLLTLCLLRVFEYVAVASKSFAVQSYRFELAGIFYDVWLWLIYCGVLFFPILVLYKLNKRAGIILFHTLNILFIICCLGLLITFSERNTPFDHELFTRKSKDTIDTIKQMLGAGVKPYVPFIIYLPAYFILYITLTKKITAPKPLLTSLTILTTLALIFIRFANPSPDWFKQSSAYYLTTNKLSYWINDSYHYLFARNDANAPSLAEEIDFYHANHPFKFTSSEYPLMHQNTDADVLGNFFNLNPAKPNIVILVVEGLSRDFSGANAYAGSFTPFLDSLSKKSLTWDNFLSTAPGTFAAHPAISGSLPYGKRGFSIMNVMPDHLSLIKILRSNGYYARFLTGFNPDFDNMGGYIRLQGTDFILSHYPSKYKEMGVGKEGWSMGYPDDALFSRSFEVIDSVNKQPYLNIYHTGTTHLPYLFAQKRQYEKKFDQKLKTMRVTAPIKRTLGETKEVLVTFMFSDDCLRKFFSDYAKRPEYNNTIFFITGDHHIGSFPTIGEIDDYHVPFLIYSPMLKKGEKFLSVNSHNNIAPTIASFLAKNFHFNNYPQEVHWMGAVLDTAKAFRNQQSMPFMSWGREINDYLWRDYFISENQLYKLRPDLTQEKIVNDSIKKHMIRLRSNFEAVNAYVCDSNKVYPAKKELLPGKKDLLLDYTDSSTRRIQTAQPDTSLMPIFKLPKGYKFLYIEFFAAANIEGEDPDKYPTVRFALIDTKNKGKKFLYWSKRDLATLSKNEFQPKQWNDITTNDMFTLSDYSNVKDLYYELALFNTPPGIDLQIKNMRLRVYGVK